MIATLWVLSLAVAGGAAYVWGGDDREKRMRAASIVLPCKGMWAEFSLSADELSRVYTHKQLRALSSSLLSISVRDSLHSDTYDLRRIVDNACALQAAREVISNLDISK